MANNEKSAQPVDVLAGDLRRICGHDSRSVDGCVTCEAADRIETDYRQSAAVAELIDERNRLANIVNSHEAQILRMTAEAADLIGEHERAKAALADAVDWIGTMRCDDTETHPRLRVLRAALSRVQGGAA